MENVQAAKVVRECILTSTRPVLHDVRSAEDGSGIVSVAVVRVDRDLGEGSRRLSMDDREEEGAGDEEGCRQHGLD